MEKCHCLSPLPWALVISLLPSLPLAAHQVPCEVMGSVKPQGTCPLCPAVTPARSPVPTVLHRSTSPPSPAHLCMVGSPSPLCSLFPNLSANMQTAASAGEEPAVLLLCLPIFIISHCLCCSHPFWSCSSTSLHSWSLWTLLQQHWGLLRGGLSPEDKQDY